MQKLKITGVEFGDNYFLIVSLSNGHKIMFDMKPMVKTARFQALLDEVTFRKGELTEEGYIQWPGHTELSLEEIMLNLSNEINHGTVV